MAIARPDVWKLGHFREKDEQASSRRLLVGVPDHDGPAGTFLRNGFINSHLLEGWRHKP